MLASVGRRCRPRRSRSSGSRCRDRPRHRSRRSHRSGLNAAAQCARVSAMSFVNWVTCTGCHVHRAACAWLIAKFIDEEADSVSSTIGRLGHCGRCHSPIGRCPSSPSSCLPTPSDPQWTPLPPGPSADISQHPIHVVEKIVLPATRPLKVPRTSFAPFVRPIKTAGSPFSVLPRQAMFNWVLLSGTGVVLQVGRPSKEW